MHERTKILGEVLGTLEKRGFEVSERCELRPSCFDLLARREALVLLLKILSNIDSTAQEHAREMRNLAAMLSASPLLIGVRTRSFPMQSGAVYERYGVRAVNPGTFEEMLDGALPITASARGGSYAQVNGARLRQLRMELGLSFGSVAEKLGVSRKMVYEYEHESCGITPETALKLRVVFGESVIRGIGVFGAPKRADIQSDYKNKLERVVLGTLATMGFEVYLTRKAPFSALAKEERDIMLAKVVSSDSRSAYCSAKIIGSISRTIRAGAFYVVENSKKSKSNVEGIPVIKKEELKKFDAAQEFLEELRERSASCTNIFSPT